MALKIGAKLAEKLTWAFQNDLMNMAIFQAEK